jgi:hypothetical protein
MKCMAFSLVQYFTCQTISDTLLQSFNCCHKLLGQHLLLQIDDCNNCIILQMQIVKELEKE